MVASAAASFGVALTNERTLAPAFVEATPYSPLAAIPPSSPAPAAWSSAARGFIVRRVLAALAIGVAGIILAASIPAVTAVASTLRADGADTAAPRAVVGMGSPHAQHALFDAGAAGSGLARYQSPKQAAFEQSLVKLAAYRDWIAATTPASSTPARSVAAPAPSYSLNGTSGFAPGTKIRARITIYGCYGPGGGFCQHMSAGGAPFPGAVACSDNLPFGTKLKITGDPTGRTYECLDRGRLTPTWIDVYFNDTTEGMAWQSNLGTTVTEIEIVN